MIIYYIENLIDFGLDEQIEIIGNSSVRGASRDELKELKLLIGNFSFDTTHIMDLHEMQLVERTEKTDRFSKRKPDDFRYFVLETDTEENGRMICHAMLLSQKRFFVPFGFNSENKQSCWPFSHLSINSYMYDKTIFSSPREKSMLKFGAEDKTEIEFIYKLLLNFSKIDNNYPIIKKALSDYFRLEELSNCSSFKIVSIIAILELLLVDSNHDKINSINRQLQKKLNLINNRIDNSTDFTNYIKGPDTLTLEKIIEILYRYRSSIAHGDFVDFDNKLQLLQGVTKHKILELLISLLRETIIFSLKEPQLVSDIKSC